MNKTFNLPAYANKQGYSGFPMDNLANFTSAPGYLIPVYKDFLDPGDKVRLRTKLRTITQPLSKPAMCTLRERIEWFAVPIDQLYKFFSTKFYGIQDIGTDLVSQANLNSWSDYLPLVRLSDLRSMVRGLPKTFEAQAAIPSSIPTMAEAVRLCDALGYPLDTFESHAVVPDATDEKVPLQSVNLFFAAAYQKIWYDHYRLTDRDANDPQAYNLDSVGMGSSSAPYLTDTDRLRKLFTLRKRPYQLDYFTSMQVSPLMGSSDIGSSGNDLGKVQQWLSGLTTVLPGTPASSSYGSNSEGTVISNNNNPSSVRLPQERNTSNATNNRLDNIAGQINPSNIRSLFAVEKLLEVTRRAKKHYDMQTLAHFGVEVPKGLSGECFKLGTHEQYIKVNDVISTATTDQGALGQRAGAGESSADSKQFNFEAKCHCVLMALYSCEPVVNYRQTGVSRLDTMVNASDFYKPEFDNLGLQPVFQYEVCAQGTSSLQSSVIGWQPRYEQLKAKYNRSFGGINTTYFNEWALNRYVPTSVSKNFFYVWPTDMNNILQVPYTGTITDVTDFLVKETFARDPLVNLIYFDVQKSSKKSIFGIPNL